MLARCLEKNDASVLIDGSPEFPPFSNTATRFRQTGHSVNVDLSSNDHASQRGGLVAISSIT